MARNFPLSWPEWTEGIERAYQFVEEVDKRQLAGEPLSEEEERMLPVIRDCIQKYARNGHRKRREDR